MMREVGRSCLKGSGVSWSEALILAQKIANDWCVEPMMKWERLVTFAVCEIPYLAELWFSVIRV
jgi:hypothetical protein